MLPLAAKLEVERLSLRLLQQIRNVIVQPETRRVLVIPAFQSSDLLSAEWYWLAKWAGLGVLPSSTAAAQQIRRTKVAGCVRSALLTSLQPKQCTARSMAFGPSELAEIGPTASSLRLKSLARIAGALTQPDSLDVPPPPSHKPAHVFVLDTSNWKECRFHFTPLVKFQQDATAAGLASIAENLASGSCWRFCITDMHVDC